MVDHWSAARLGQVILYAVAFGIVIKVLALAWRSFWGVEISPRKLGVLAGGTAAWLALWGISRGPGVAIPGSCLIIVSFFVIALIKSRWKKQ